MGTSDEDTTDVGMFDVTIPLVSTNELPELSLSPMVSDEFSESSLIDFEDK